MQRSQVCPLKQRVKKRSSLRARDPLTDAGDGIGIRKQRLRLRRTVPLTGVHARYEPAPVLLMRLLLVGMLRRALGVALRLAPSSRRTVVFRRQHVGEVVGGLLLGEPRRVPLQHWLRIAPQRGPGTRCAASHWGHPVSISLRIRVRRALLSVPLKGRASSGEGDPDGLRAPWA
eukprot:scaffold1402_cov254-Pinguiococcus_pyrenoidosus.AAC.23